MNGPARAAMGACWPSASSIASPNWHTASPNSPQASDSHSAMRTERRTSRTAWRRRPSSAAISGATAPVRPEKVQVISPSSEVVRLAAASGSVPNRAMKMTSVV